ncbi:MAG: RagB/SusD family nutrient uptake outer membrane protein [Segetibacter sp.]
MIKSFPGARDYWDDHYKLINFANTALQTADSLKLSAPADQINLAEARFFRAFAYFDLVRTFGEVPKIDFRIYEASQANIAKSPIVDIYNLIDQDLEFAEATLPLSWGNKFIGRITSGAARTLHAKSYLFRGDFGQTLAFTQAIINS